MDRATGRSTDAAGGVESQTALQAAEKLGGLQAIEPVEHDAGTGGQQLVGVAASIDRDASHAAAPGGRDSGGRVLDHEALAGRVSQARAASKQADVLMLHLLVPELVPPDSLCPDRPAQPPPRAVRRILTSWVCCNAFTNVMARWNLLHAAALAQSGAEEAYRWRACAAALADGYAVARGRVPRRGRRHAEGRRR